MSVCLCVCFSVCVSVSLSVCQFVCSLTRDNEDIPILVPVISTVACCTVTNCESRGLVADQLEMNILKFRFVLRTRVW